MLTLLDDSLVIEYHRSFEIVIVYRLRLLVLRKLRVRNRTRLFILFVCIKIIIIIDLRSWYRFPYRDDFWLLRPIVVAACILILSSVLHIIDLNLTY